jgi:hypothetical protein
VALGAVSYQRVGEPESIGTTVASRRPWGVERKPRPIFGLQSATDESLGPQAARSVCASATRLSASGGCRERSPSARPPVTSGLARGTRRESWRRKDSDRSTVDGVWSPHRANPGSAWSCCMAPARSDTDCARLRAYFGYRRARGAWGSGLSSRAAAAWLENALRVVLTFWRYSAARHKQRPVCMACGKHVAGRRLHFRAGISWLHIGCFIRLQPSVEDKRSA